MRVLMVSWEYPPKIVGGLGRHVTALSHALCECGVRVSVLTNSNDGPEREVHGSLEIVRVREHTPPALNLTEHVAQANTAMLQGLVSVLRDGDSFDLVHAHDWLTAFAARAAKHGLDVPLVATIHATEWGRNGGLFTDEQRRISDIEWWLAFEAWRVVCCSHAMKGELERYFQVPSDKIKIIPNGVDFPEKGDESAPAVHGDPLLLFVGRLVYEKGVDVLLHAFHGLVQSFPHAVLAIAGKGPQEGELHRLARDLGIETRVRFLGFISDQDRNALYRAADAAVFPSRYEPFGIVALEAMAHGAPVVAARTGGLAEVVGHRETGLLFSPGDARALQQELSELLSSPQTASNLRARADRYVRTTFDWHSIAEETINVYREVLGSGLERAQLAQKE